MGLGHRPGPGSPAADTPDGRDRRVSARRGQPLDLAAADSSEKVNFTPAQFATSNFVVFRRWAAGRPLWWSAARRRQAGGSMHYVSSYGVSMDNELYDYSPITERSPLHWPGGARVAFYVGLNIEHFHIDSPSTSLWEGTASLVPDPLNYGWRDYGPRVGVWRLIESLDRHGIRASALLNSEVAHRYPHISAPVRNGTGRGWRTVRPTPPCRPAWPHDEERAFFTEVVETIEHATGRRPRGWLGPGLTETFQTPALLAELGLSYVLDWTSDDQPYRLNVPGMLSVPYSVELNDIDLFMSKGLSGPDFPD